MGLIKSCLYGILGAAAVYAGVRTGGCDYLMDKVGAPEHVKIVAKESTDRCAKSIDDVAKSVYDYMKSR
jgi:hypothetical protein